MLLETWTEVLTRSFQDLWLGVVDFVPSLIAAVIIFVIGWVVGSILGRVVAQIIASLKVDNALRSTGVEEALSRAGFGLNSGKFVGALVKWFIIVAFLVAALDALNLNQVNDFLQNVVLVYLPNVIVAVLILLIAAVVAEVLQNIVVGAAKAAQMTSARLMGSIARWAIWIFAILVALDQLGIASSFIQTLYVGVVAALAIGAGLAFGLGGQDAAARTIERVREEISSHH